MAEALEVDDIDRLVRDNSSATGIAVLIGNSYEHCSKGTKKLAGPPKDIDRARRVFSRFGAACLIVENKTAKKTKAIIDKVARTEYPDSYQYIVVMFSGHGNKGGVLLGNDWKPMHVEANITEKFQPKTAELRIAKLPKLFFIDACRGTDETGDVQVPRGADEDGYEQMPRGGKGVDSIRLPEKGNMLLAFSTLPEKFSYEVGLGGTWITRMLEKLGTTNEDVTVIFQIVNGELMEHFQDKKELKLQQPVLTTTLHAPFNFHKFLPGSQAIALDESLPSTQGLPRQGSTSFTSVLNALKTDKKIASRAYTDIHGHGNHTMLSITLPNGEACTFRSSEYCSQYDSINSAQERVAEAAINYITRLHDNPSVGATAVSKSSTSEAAGKSPPMLVSIKEKTASQELKNLLDQLKLPLTEDNFEYMERKGKSGQQFICTFKHKSPLFPSAIKGDWKSSKKEAKRSVSRKALLHYQSHQQ